MSLFIVQISYRMFSGGESNVSLWDVCGWPFEAEVGNRELSSWKVNKWHHEEDFQIFFFFYSSHSVSLSFWRCFYQFPSTSIKAASHKHVPRFCTSLSLDLAPSCLPARGGRAHSVQQVLQSRTFTCARSFVGSTYLRFSVDGRIEKNGP